LQESRPAHPLLDARMRPVHLLTFFPFCKLVSAIPKQIRLPRFPNCETVPHGPAKRCLFHIRVSRTNAVLGRVSRLRCIWPHFLLVALDGVVTMTPMTMPDERYRSLLYVRDFLYDLLDPKMTERVPSAVRQRARRVLRHYPLQYEIELLAKKAPELLDANSRQFPVLLTDTTAAAGQGSD